MPLHEHKCPACVYLCQFLSMEHGLCDLYLCRQCPKHPMVTLRWGSDVEYSPPDSDVDWVVAAIKCATTKGLWPIPAEVACTCDRLDEVIKEGRAWVIVEAMTDLGFKATEIPGVSITEHLKRHKITLDEMVTTAKEKIMRLPHASIATLSDLMLNHEPSDVFGVMGDNEFVHNAVLSLSQIGLLYVLYDLGMSKIDRSSGVEPSNN